MAMEGWEDNPDLKKLYVAKLKQETTEDTVINYFGKLGTVSDIKIIKDQDGNSRGFGFVTMSDQAVVDNILETRPHTIDGQTAFLRRAIPKDDPNPLAQAKTKKLFIGGLNEEATEEDIKSVLAIFTQHPPEQIKLMRDRNTNKFKGYAFAIFHSEDIVDKLFIIRNATIKNKKVEMKKAEEIGGPGGGGGARGRGRGGSGFRGGRGAGPPRSGGGAGAGGSSGYTPSAYSAYSGYSAYGDGSYGADDYSYGGYPQYGNGYDNYSGGYSAGYGGGYSSGYNSGEYGSEPSSYGPNRRGGGGRGRGGGGGGGYRPY